jgi:hypothetical protein
MNEPEGTGSERKKEHGEDIVLPSWIDAAISRTRSTDDVPGEDAPAPEDEWVDPAHPESPTEESVRPVIHPDSSEQFPSFLDRRGSMAYETERIVQEQPAHEDPAPEPFELESNRDAPPDFLAGRARDEFDAQREEIVAQALADDATAHTEQIPLPVAPPRKRTPSGPWLMAAIFFAAAAIVLAVLIWLKPLP